MPEVFLKLHIVLLLLILLGIITFLDRMCIAVAGPRIQASLRISTERWGWVLGAFILSCGIFKIPSGAWGDRWGHRGVLSRIVLWWSVFACLTGAATGFVSLLLVRFLFGAGEASGYPNIAGVMLLQPCLLLMFLPGNSTWQWPVGSLYIALRRPFRSRFPGFDGMGGLT